MENFAIKSPEPWRRRLTVPFYKVSEAARYAHSTSGTVGRWHKLSVVASKAPRAELSYLQLIEVAVVAAMRRGGVRLRKIKEAHDYFGKMLETEFPFAEYRFKSIGNEIGIDYQQIDPNAGIDKLLASGGQYGWANILKPLLREFVYEDHGMAVKWHVAGKDSKILIDPQVAFGAPQISGIATWAVLGRYRSGEGVMDIAEDLGLNEADVVESLKFEGIEPDLGRQNYWVN